MVQGDELRHGGALERGVERPRFHNQTGDIFALSYPRRGILIPYGVDDVFRRETPFDSNCFLSFIEALSSVAGLRKRRTVGLYKRRQIGGCFLERYRVDLEGRALHAP